ncbi:MAG: hypothetical protein HC836_10800 [Richelia sp. RM2_1_2]|nr:hypothetical protein [Richelia sp. RM2_1_2]
MRLKRIRNEVFNEEGSIENNVQTFDSQLTFETFCNDSSNIHRQWDLLREGDKSSLPNDDIWRKLKDSLVGVNSQGEIVPDPNLSEVERYGILFRPRQTWFKYLQEARKVFIQKVNELLLVEPIVSTREDWDKNLFLTEPEPDAIGAIYKIDSLGAGVYEYELPAPFSNISQVSVSTDLDGIQQYTVDYTLSGTNKLIFVVTKEPVIGDIINVTIKNYDYKVVDLANRDALIGTILPGQLVLVEPTIQTNSKWTIWLYDPATPPIPTWRLIDEQAYNVSDTWYYVDWYAAGYSVDTEINYVFPDTAAFNATLSVPDDQIPYNSGDVIKIEDNGSGVWNLLLFGDSITKIGEERGTIQFSDIFYTHISGNEQSSTNVSSNSTSISNTDVYGYDSSSFEEIPYDALPDETAYPYIEFGIIFDSLTVDILTNLEINEVFFTMVRYVHTEQNMIDWIFKTSYIYLIGTEEELQQSPILRTDFTNDFINYINEVKPYHVKIRDYQQNKTAPIEIYDCLSTDFDLPPYYDSVAETYRPLDVRSNDDENIISNSRPWSEWYEDYILGADFDSQDRATNPGNNVRKFTSSLYFDRVKCWTNVPISGFNTDNITFVSNAVNGDYVLFTVSAAKISIKEVRLIVETPIEIIYIGDGSDRVFKNPRILKQESSITVWKDGVLQVNGPTYNVDDYEIVDNGIYIQFHIAPDIGEEIKIRIDETFDDDSFITIGDSNLGNSTITLAADGQLKDFYGVKVLPLQNTNYNFDTNIIVNFNSGLSTHGIVRVEIDYDLIIKFSEININEYDAADRVAMLYNPLLSMEQKTITTIPNQDRIKGNTLTSSDNVKELFYRQKYNVNPISGCEYSGVIHDSQPFASSGFDTVEFGLLPFDLETEQTNLDVILNGGIDHFDTLYFEITTKGWEIVPWDIEGWNAELNYTYIISGTFALASQIIVSVNGNPPLVNGVDYSTTAPNIIEFIPSSNSIKLDDVVQVVLAPFSQTFIEAPLNSSDISVDGNEFLQPYYDNKHPEELVRTKPNNSLNMDIYYESKVGCPIIISDRIVGDGTTFEYELLQVPQNLQAVWVYSGGILLRDNIDYVFNQELNGIRFFTAPASGDSIKITTFSAGGERIDQQIFYTGNGVLGGSSDPIKIRKPNITQNVSVFVNGVLANHLVNNDDVIITPTPSSGSQIQVTVFSPDILERIFNDAGSSTFTLTTVSVTNGQIQVLVNNQAHGFILIGNSVVLTPTVTPGDNVLITVYELPKLSIVQTDTFVATQTGSELFILSNAVSSTKPIDSAIFVRKNGLRLAPEHTLYQTSSEGQILYTFSEPVDLLLYTVKIWINNTQQIPGSDFTYNYISASIIDSITFNTPLTAGNQISVVVDKDQAKFEVINPTTIEVFNVIPGDVLQISYFSFDDTWNIKTEVFEQHPNGIYDLAQSPYDSDYIWVHVNGYRQILNKTYLLRNVDPGFDTENFSSSSGFDDESIGKSKVLMNPYIDSISAYGTHPDASLSSSGCVTTSPNLGWDITPWDSTVDLLLPAPPTGPLNKGILSHPWDCDYHDPDLEWFDTLGFDAELLESIEKDEIIITTVAGPAVKRSFGYKMFGDTADEFSFSNIADADKLVLREDLYFYNDGTDREKEIWLDVNPKLHVSQINDNILYTPTGSLPGLLYINGERIEYWAVETYTDSITNRPYYRIPYSSITFGNPVRVEKLPKFLRKTKGTAVGAPEYLNSIKNSELVIPKNTIVIPCGPDTTTGVPFETGNVAGSIKLQTTTVFITGTGFGTTYQVPILPARATITSALNITGSSNPSDPSTWILRTDYRFEGNNIIFDAPISLGFQIALVSVDINEFDISTVNTDEAMFLRSNYATYEK